MRVNSTRPNGTINVTLGLYSITGPRCMLKQMDGLRTGRCYDSGSTTMQPGGQVSVLLINSFLESYLTIFDVNQ
jgi:hypothetical protein